MIYLTICLYNWTNKLNALILHNIKITGESYQKDPKKLAEFIANEELEKLKEAHLKKIEYLIKVIDLAY